MSGMNITSNEAHDALLQIMSFMDEHSFTFEEALVEALKQGDIPPNVYAEILGAMERVARGILTGDIKVKLPVPPVSEQLATLFGPIFK